MLNINRKNLVTYYLIIYKLVIYKKLKLKVENTLINKFQLII